MSAVNKIGTECIYLGECIIGVCVVCFDKNDVGTIYVRTEGTGFRRCGNCYCAVREDGMIQYQGLTLWQRSEWKDFEGEAEPLRPFGAEISERQYAAALRTIAAARAKKLKECVDKY